MKMCSSDPPEVPGARFALSQPLEDPALILIADDDEVTRILLRRAMQKEGYQVIEAANGEQCIEAYTRFRPDLVLLDAMMPVIDGFACCRHLVDLSASYSLNQMPYEQTPILMVTGLEDTESVDQAFAAGATDYITKPIRWAVLLQRVRWLIKAHRAAVELRYRTERERLVGSIAERIHQSLNLQEILQTAVADIQQFLQTDRVFVYRFNPDWSGTVIVESVAKDWISMAGMTIQDPCFADTSLAHLYRLGRIQVLEDIYDANLRACYLGLLTQFQVRASLVIPIRQNNQLWGLLVAHHCSGAHQWHTWEIELVERLTIQLAIAIQQSILFEQVQRINVNLEYQVQERTIHLQERTIELQRALELEATLKRITDQVRDSLDESQILQTAVKELALALGAGCCNAALYNPEQKISQIHYEYVSFIAGNQGQAIFMEDFAEIYQQLAQGQCFQFCTVALNFGKAPVAMLACPMMNGQDAIGDLWLINPTDRTLSELEIRLVQQVANQCAIAIRQARLYQAAEAQVKELERLNQLKDDFLCTISHELRTPVATIKMALQMLEFMVNQPESLLEKLDSLTQYLSISQVECDKEIKLINDLLTLQQLEAGEASLVVEFIDLYEWLPQVLHPFREQTADLQLSFELDLPATLPLVSANSFCMERILTELLTNAYKYTPPQGVITLSATSNAEYIQLCVTNSGVEIPEHEIPRIFDKFYRILSNDPWKHGGTGLGLALVKKLVNHLGGVIAVTSANQKTNFIVQFPLKNDGSSF